MGQAELVSLQCPDRRTDGHCCCLHSCTLCPNRLDLRTPRHSRCPSYNPLCHLTMWRGCPSARAHCPCSSNTLDGNSRRPLYVHVYTKHSMGLTSTTEDTVFSKKKAGAALLWGVGCRSQHPNTYTPLVHSTWSTCQQLVHNVQTSWMHFEQSRLVNDTTCGGNMLWIHCKKKRSMTSSLCVSAARRHSHGYKRARAWHECFQPTDGRHITAHIQWILFTHNTEIHGQDYLSISH